MYLMANSADPDQLASSKASYMYIRVQQDKGLSFHM